MEIKPQIAALQNLLPLTICLLLCTMFAGCASIPRTLPASIKHTPGVYHRVKKGQTLWRIAKAYGVDLEKISRVNNLADTSRIYSGQLIFIPEAKVTLEDLTLKVDFQDKGGDFIWPLKGKVTSFFGMKRDKVKNKGIYIQAAKEASVYATRSGKVAFCSENFKGYGKIIIIDHMDGYSTVYAQNLRNMVKLNQLIRQGQVIAKAGSGYGASNPELYFEIRKGHSPENPFFYLP